MKTNNDINWSLIILLALLAGAVLCGGCYLNPELTHDYIHDHIVSTSTRG